MVFALCLGVVGTTLALIEARRQERIALIEARQRGIPQGRGRAAADRRGAASFGREAAGPGDEEAARTRRPGAAQAASAARDRDCEETGRIGPMAESIRDLLASSPEAKEVLKAFLPRAP